jgi:hypothetical protein
MDYQYDYSLTAFPNQKVDLQTLQVQVRASAIIIALDYINSGSTVIFFFKAELSVPDVSILSEVVAAHTGVPGPATPQIVRSETLTEHIKWIEAGDVTQGLYAAKSIIIDLSTNDTEKIVDIVFPFNVALMSGTLGVADDMIGDECAIEIAPNTLVGAFTQPISVGDTSIYVSPTVIQNIKSGYYISTYDPDGDGEDIGQVIEFCSQTSCLRIDGGSPIEVSAGTYTAMTVKIVPYLYFHDMHTIEIGKQITTGQRIPAGVPVRIHYHNNNLAAKKVSFFIEYLY